MLAMSVAAMTANIAIAPPWRNSGNRTSGATAAPTRLNAHALAIDDARVRVGNSSAPYTFSVDTYSAAAGKLGLGDSVLIAYSNG